MTRDMDKVIFESRREIEDIQKALTQYVSEHSEDTNGTVEKMIDILEVIHMNW